MTGGALTLRNNARLAGVAYLVYIAAGISNEILMHRATAGDGAAAVLARIAEYAIDVRIAILLKLLECFSAFVIGVTLFAITRDVDRELALLAMLCRIAEGAMIGAILVPTYVGLLWLATSQTDANALDAATVNTLMQSLMMPVGPVGAIFFAVGMTIFSYLLLLGRLIPVWLAGLGLFSSVLLAIGLPLQLAGFGFLSGPLAAIQWVPEMIFTGMFALWLLVKGVRVNSGQ